MTTYKLILLVILLLAFSLRIIALPVTPPGLWYDEAYYAMDALWLTQTNDWPLFFPGNNGREPLFIYVEMVFLSLFGATPLTARLLGSFSGMLTIPLMYVWARRLTRDLPQSQWIALVATAGLAISFWHIALSRTGFRVVHLPLMTLLVFYTFWRAWQSRATGWLIIAGMALGLSQYTYLAARALPLVLAGFAVGWTMRVWAKPDKPAEAHIDTLLSLWHTMVGMAIISLIVFAPLGWQFYQQPELFSARTGDVLFQPNDLGDLFYHVGSAVRLFVDGGHGNWRHHLPGRPMVGWLGWLGFFPGLIISLYGIRRPNYLFLWAGLTVLFLPALLSTPPIHALRLSNLLPFYLLINALGLVIGLKSLIVRRWQYKIYYAQIFLVTLILTAETGLTSYDYFYRWANDHSVYEGYNGPLTDLIDNVITHSEQQPILIPLDLYTHPTARFLLADQFQEQRLPTALPDQPLTVVALQDKFRVLNVGNIPTLSGWVWLYDGKAYVSRPFDPAVQEQLAAQATTDTMTDRFGQPLADFKPLADTQLIAPFFRDAPPRRQLHVRWLDQAELYSYDLSHSQIDANQSLTVNLYWRSLTDLTFEQTLFLQIVDVTGQPIYQWEGQAFIEDMYRWRADEGLLARQHPLWVSAEAQPGPHLIRLGFFEVDDQTVRLPISAIQQQVVDQPTDQVYLGLFRVGESAQPATPLAANFAEQVELIGVTVPEERLTDLSSSLSVTLFWRTQQPTDRPYTVFLQLINAQNEVVAGWDQQPFNGLYPTSAWSPEEQLYDTFQIPLPVEGVPTGEYRLVTGLYDVASGARLPLTTGGDMVDLRVWVEK